MNKKKLNRSEILRTAGALMLAFTARSAFATEINLTTGADLSGIVNGAVFSNPTTLSNIISGTGVFNTFVQIQNNPIEQGYNTSARNGFPTNPPTDTNSQTNFDTNNAATHNHDIQLNDVNTILYNGIVYRQFLLDINESNNVADYFLSLDKVQIYMSNTPGNFIAGDNQAVLGADNTLGKLVYDMDAGVTDGDSRILLNDLVFGSGSGRPDLQMLIPNSLFLNLFANGFSETSNLYLYSRFGDKGCVDSSGNTVTRPANGQCPANTENFSGDYGSNATFEEWANLVGTNVSDYCALNPNDPQCKPPIIPDPSVPEPGILSLLGLGLLGLGSKARRKSL